MVIVLVLKQVAIALVLEKCYHCKIESQKSLFSQNNQIFYKLEACVGTLFAMHEPSFLCFCFDLEVKSSAHF